MKINFRAAHVTLYHGLLPTFDEVSEFFLESGGYEVTIQDETKMVLDDDIALLM